MSAVPTKWATVCVAYAGNENARLECVDSATFTFHQTEARALEWTADNVSAGQMVAVLKVERLFTAQAVEVK